VRIASPPILAKFPAEIQTSFEKSAIRDKLASFQNDEIRTHIDAAKSGPIQGKTRCPGLESGIKRQARNELPRRF
jgi:hypothetical protein